MTLIEDLHNKQLPKETIPKEHHLRRSDILRMAKRLPSPPFHPTECCILHINRGDRISTRKSYPNFWMKTRGKSRKSDLARILYINYKGELDADDYLSRSCSHDISDVCVNLNHLVKHTYKHPSTAQSDEILPVSEPIPIPPKKSFKVNFD